jgi:hypothetical protein
MYFIFSVMYVELCKFRSSSLLWQQCTYMMVNYAINFKHIKRCTIVDRPINSCT